MTPRFNCVLSTAAAMTLASFPAHSTVVVTDFSFSSQDQSMFANGTAPITTFQKTVFQESFADRTYGAFQDFRNPLWTEWNDDLGDLPQPSDCSGFGASICREVRNANIAAWKILNPQPTKTFKNLGGSITFGFNASAGYSGQVGFGDGVVNTTYTGKAVTTVGEIQSDGTLALITTQANAMSTLASDFPDLVVDLDVDTSVAARANVRGRFVNALGNISDETKTVLNVNEAQTTEIISGALSEDGLTIGTLGLPDSSFNTSSFGPSNYYAGTNGSFFLGGPSLGIPILGLSAKYPEMDIDTSSFFGEDSVSGNVQPIERLFGEATTLEFGNTPASNSDVARFELDVDGIMGLPFGFGAEIKAPGRTLIGMEANVLDFDLASYFSLGQTLKFDPRMKVRYEFSTPVKYILPNGEQSTILVSSLTIGLGDELRIVHPQSDDFEITPTFTLNDAQLFNEILGYMDFAVETDWLQFRLFGEIASNLNADIDAALLKTILGLNSDPIQLFSMGSETVGFALGGFDDVLGQSISISGVPAVATVPLPPSTLLFASALVGLGSVPRLRRRR